MFRYKKLYEELQAKVEPFMEQLDAFEAEKMMLLGRFAAYIIHKDALSDVLFTQYCLLDHLLVCLQFLSYFT